EDHSFDSSVTPARVLARPRLYGISHPFFSWQVPPCGYQVLSQIHLSRRFVGNRYGSYLRLLSPFFLNCSDIMDPISSS
ncbi:hypothetical protein LINGRAHAP2_LOCUS29191, partial [Linum grandiflorum]